MKRIVIGIIVAMVVVLAPALTRAEEGMNGWEKTLELGAQLASASDDLKLVAVGQGNAVFLFDEAGKQFFTLKVDKTAAPLVSPDGSYVVIQTEGSGEATRNVYVYSSEPKLLWSMRDLPATGRFSGNGEYILFSSPSKGGAILMAVGNRIVWNKGPWEIKLGWKRMLISQAGEVIAFNHEGTFNLEGKRIKQMDIGSVFDLSRDGSLIMSQLLEGDKIHFKLSDTAGVKKWESMIPADPVAGEEAVLGVSINQDIDRVAMVGNGQGRGYLYLMDLAGKMAWAKADLPKVLAGDLNAVKVARNHVRVKTVDGLLVYNLQGQVTWKTPGPGYDCLVSDDGQRVILISGNTISYQGPGDYLSLGVGTEAAGAAAPAPAAAEAGYPEGGTAPAAGAAQAVTQAVQPAPTTAPVVTAPQVVTVPVLPVEGAKAPEGCSCLISNIIVALLAVVLSILGVFLSQKFLKKK